MVDVLGEENDKKICIINVAVKIVAVKVDSIVSVLKNHILKVVMELKILTVEMVDYFRLKVDQDNVFETIILKEEIQKKDMDIVMVDMDVDDIFVDRIKDYLKVQVNKVSLGIITVPNF